MRDVVLMDKTSADKMRRASAVSAACLACAVPLTCLGRAVLRLNLYSGRYDGFAAVASVAVLFGCASFLLTWSCLETACMRHDAIAVADTADVAAGRKIRDLASVMSAGTAVAALANVNYVISTPSGDVLAHVYPVIALAGCAVARAASVRVAAVLSGDRRKRKKRDV